MPDAYATIRLSEQRDVFVTLTPLVGTAIINSGSVTIYDSSGLVAGGVNGVPVTGSTSGTLAAPQAWYLLKPSALGLVPGVYSVAFLLNVLASGVSSVDEPVVGVVVLPDGG